MLKIMLLISVGKIELILDVKFIFGDGEKMVS